MDYTPRYSQPFTLAQAVLFDVAVINEGHEIPLFRTDRQPMIISRGIQKSAAFKIP
jgi:hypothetical protein